MERLQAIHQENDIYTIKYDNGIYIGTIFHPMTGKVYKKLVGQNKASLQKNLIDWLYSSNFRKI